jgi:hypothetical protein
MATKKRKAAIRISNTPRSGFRPQRNTYRLTERNYKFLCRVADRGGMTLNAALNVILADAQEQTTISVLPAKRRK